MTNNINFSSIFFALLLFSAVPAHSNQTEQQKLLERIEMLNILIRQASDTNSLWRETKNLSANAREHTHAENYILANEALTKAEFQANQGIQQTLEQSDVTDLIPSYLRH
jgi:hypothetical protein